MKDLLKSIKSVFLTGLLIVFPAWLATLLFLKVLLHLRGLVKPITIAMPEGVNHPMPWSILADKRSKLTVSGAAGVARVEVMGGRLGRAAFATHS